MKLIFSTLLLVFSLSAQTQPWSNVEAASAGTEIRVLRSGAAPVRGTLKSINADSLVVNNAAGDTTLSRQSITRVSVKKEGRRRRNAAIGAGVGAAGGLIIGAAADSKCSKQGCFFGNNFSKIVLTPFGALVGTLVGVLLPTGGWRDIYKP